MWNKTLAMFVLVALVAGCASVEKVERGGAATIGERLSVPTDAAWNQLRGHFSGTNSAAVWTTEGLFIDQLNFYDGLKDGEALAASAPGSSQRPLNFRASMQGHEIAALFEAMYTRDGSRYQLDRLEPVSFLGQGGWRARFTLVRKFDDVKLSGTVWATVRDGRLYAITFAAPTLAFHPRLAPMAEQVATAARFK